MNKPAFPIIIDSSIFHSGLSKREYYAAMALSLLPVTITRGDKESAERVARVAQRAVEIADALIAALEKE